MKNTPNHVHELTSKDQQSVKEKKSLGTFAKFVNKKLLLTVGAAAMVGISACTSKPKGTNANSLQEIEKQEQKMLHNAVSENKNIQIREIDFSYDTVALANDPQNYEVSKGELRGIIDKQGKELLPIKYKQINQIGNVMYKVIGADDKVGLVKDYEIVIPAIYNDITVREEGFIVTVDGKAGFLDKNYKLVLPIIYDSLELEEKNMFKVEVEGKFGLMDQHLNLVVPTVYEEIEGNGNNTFIVKVKGKLGLMDQKQKVLLPPEYEDITFINDGYYQLQKQGNMFLFNSHKNEIMKYPSDSQWIGGKFFLLERGYDNTLENSIIDKDGTVVLPFTNKILGGTFLEGVFSAFTLEEGEKRLYPLNKRIGKTNEDMILNTIGYFDTVTGKVLSFKDAYAIDPSINKVEEVPDPKDNVKQTKKENMMEYAKDTHMDVKKNVIHIKNLLLKKSYLVEYEDEYGSREKVLKSLGYDFSVNKNTNTGSFIIGDDNTTVLENGIIVGAVDGYVVIEDAGGKIKIWNTKENIFMEDQFDEVISTGNEESKIVLRKTIPYGFDKEFTVDTSGVHEN